MQPSFNDKLIAYLVLFSGLAISAVAEYYSIMGLMAIYPAALIPIVIMGVVLGIGKISATVWLKQNWEWSPFFLKAYVLPAIIVLMLITSLGVFGFLSKAHSDQSLVSGDVLSKIAIYDEKIKTQKDNIEANRRALKQMDEGVDSVLGRSSDEKGADKAVALRKAQQKERVRLQTEILQSQKSIAELTDARAPIAAEVRKVEAEVGPIKYIAHLLYGENPDANILEKAVIWVTVLIVIVLDPLAVVLLLASQYSFQRFRELAETNNVYIPEPKVEEPKVEEPEVENVTTSTHTSTITTSSDIISTSTVNYTFLDEFTYDPDISSMGRAEWVEKSTPNFEGVKDPDTDEWIQTGPSFDEPDPYDGKEYVMVDGQNMHVAAARLLHPHVPRRSSTNIDTAIANGYVQNEEQGEDTKWNRVISEAEYREQVNKKTYDNKDNTDNPT